MNKPNEPMRVGGQALLEGVMMRSPNSMAVVCRRADGSITIKEDRWIALWDRWPLLKKPFVRGALVLVEAMWNGISALSFSAKLFAEDEDEKEKAEKEAQNATKETPATESSGSPDSGATEGEKSGGLSNLYIGLTIAVSLVFAMALFVVAPHMATAYAGALFGTELTVDMVSFHIIDGIIKIAIFLTYVWAISFLPDIKRTFMYHGAEHMAIAAFDENKELTVDNVRPYTTLHPRCGTSFIIVVLISSILLFSAMFPFMPKFPEMPKLLRHLVYIAIKLPLMFPIAGLSYELIRLAGKYPRNKLLRSAVWPGLMTQKITTKRPTDDMLEISILSMKKCLWREKQLEDGAQTADGSVSEYPDFAAAVADLGAPEMLFEGGSCEVQ